MSAASPATVLGTLGRLVSQVESTVRNGELWVADAGENRPPWTDDQRAELDVLRRKLVALRAALTDET